MRKKTIRLALLLSLFSHGSHVSYDKHIENRRGSKKTRSYPTILYRPGGTHD